MESISAFLLTSVFVQWSSLGRYITQKIKKSITNNITNYNGLCQYIYIISHVLFANVDKDYNIFVIGQINSNYTFKDNNLKGYWFIMKSSLMDPCINFKLYDTLGRIIDDLNNNEKLILTSRIQKRHDSAIIIQKYFKGWKARMKYRYNPETTLCMWVLKKEFTEMSYHS